MRMYCGCQREGESARQGSFLGLSALPACSQLFRPLLKPNLFFQVTFANLSCIFQIKEREAPVPHSTLKVRRQIPFANPQLFRFVLTPPPRCSGEL